MRTVERNALVEKHLPMVRRIAGRLHRTLLRTLDFEDLVQNGVLGLIDACERFQPASVENVEAAFMTYAAIKIRGAILDEARKHYPGTRSKKFMVYSLDEPITSTTGEDCFEEIPRAETIADPHDHEAQAVVNLDLQRAMNVLRPRTRALIRMRYLEDLSFVRIGRRMCLTSGRCSQIHKAAMYQMRSAVA